MAIMLSSSRLNAGRAVLAAEGGTLTVYDGIRPVDGDAPLAPGTIALLTLIVPSAALAAANGELSLSSPVTAIAGNSGTAVFFELIFSPMWRLRGDCGSVNGSGADLQLTTLNIIAGASTTISTLTYKDNNGTV